MFVLYKCRYIYITNGSLTFCLISELGASLFEIAQSLFTLERSFILGAMALNKKKSNEQTDIIQILSGSLMSDIRTKEHSKNG